VALLQVLRCSRNVQVQSHNKHTPAWCKKAANRANLATAHSQVDDALAHVAALSAFIPPPHSLTPPVLECQWQPNDKELLRKRRAQNLNGEGGSASGREISAHGAQSQLSSSTRFRQPSNGNTPHCTVAGEREAAAKGEAD